MKRISQFLINLLIFGILNIYLLGNKVPLKDLVTPVMTKDKPAPGKRVRQVAPEYKGTKVYHTLYLPTDWQKAKHCPVLVEYTGNKFPACGSTGEVIWNDEKQEGYMSLENLAVNDPTKNQYQLWIVDPKRDELPVDGGVFDITLKDGKSIIPIRNALAINKPVAFVITLEQSGGVVKSKQEVVVALAKS